MTTTLTRKPARKVNVMTPSQVKNTFPGVYWHSNRKKWQAIFSHDGQQVWCGYGPTPRLAYEKLKAKKKELGITHVVKRHK